MQNNFNFSAFKIYIKSIDNISELSQTSDIWKILFNEREREILESSLDNFLSIDSNQASGTGDTNSNHLIHSKEVKEYIESTLSENYFKRFTSSMIGNPPVLQLFGKETNLAFVWNLARFAHYHEILEQLNLLPVSANMIEVGPGYGEAASFWISTGKVNSYTLVDLKENLINSYYFLSHNFTDWNLNLVDELNPVSFKPKTFNFLTPERFKEISKSSFDIVLNSDSFGEMPKKVAQSYIEKLTEMMKPNALMISMNGQRRGEINLLGVQRVSDYGYQKLKLIHFSYKYMASSAYDDFGHLAILQKTNHTQDFYNWIDTLGDLFAIGINSDLDPLLLRLNNGLLNDDDKELLHIASNFFDGKYSINANAVLEYIYYMQNGIINKITDLNRLNEILKKIKSPQARYFSVLLFYINNDIYDDAIINESPYMKFLSTDLKVNSSGSFLIKYSHKLIRRDQLRKKLFPRITYRPSLVLQLKYKLTIFKNWWKRISLY